jgi:GT2 family glycosyltransferase
VLVDRGSVDGSIPFVREKYAGTRVVGLTSERGTGAGDNAAVRSCQSELVAMLDSGTRVDSGWLSALVSAAERHDAAAVASKILDWTGEAIESAGTGMSFVGHSWPMDAGLPAARAYEERPLLWADVRSALYVRSTFLAAGGFDEDFDARSADMDLGWRLNLSGSRVVLAPDAVAYQRQPDAAPRWSAVQRLRLQERNALAMIYKNYEAATLDRVFPVAVALLLLRATMGSGIDDLTLALSERPPSVVDTQPHLAARLIALEDFARQLPAINRKREAVQQRRRRSDKELFELFGDPLRLDESNALYEEVGRALIREFGVEELVSPGSSQRVTVAGRRHDPQHPPSVSVGLPHVSIVILTALGATHLRECLDSLRQQDYPADRIEIIIVDNGSSENPTAEVHARFPDARVIRNERNAGFAGGNNQGMAAATGEYVVFLNDDTRVRSDWLRELVDTARRRNAAAVASYILDWSGKRIDFVDSAVNFQGKGFQLEYGDSARRRTPREKPLLFACGCAVLMERAVLAGAGGWDEGMFAYYEDVELGWRLHVLGHEVWLAPRAVVYHKHHGTSKAWPEPPRIRLYERNSLRGLFCVLDDASLRRVLPAALLLAADRALLESGLSRAADDPGTIIRRLAVALKAALRARGISKSTPIGHAIARIWREGPARMGRDVLRLSASEQSSRRTGYLVERGMMPPSLDEQAQPVPIAAAAMMSGLFGFLCDIPQLVERRRELQGQRRVGDSDILGRFGTHWLEPSGSRLQAEHYAMHASIVEELGIAGSMPLGWKGVRRR